MTSSELVRTYTRPSSFEGGVLNFATSEKAAAETLSFFQGQLLRPQVFAKSLRMIGNIAATRFYTPPGMLAKILREADPIISSGYGALRFEAFSPCCGVYGRLDVYPSMMTVVNEQVGTTNIDLNAPMLTALAGVGASDQLSVAVGADEFALIQNADVTVEKKVKLPERWIHSLMAVQIYLANMQHRHRIRKVDASRLFNALPSTIRSAQSYYLTPSGQSLRLSMRAGPKSIRIGGVDRLRVITSLIPLAEHVDVYVEPHTGASCWVLNLDGYSFSLVLSPDASRGFSGEGVALQDLVTPPDPNALKRCSTLILEKGALTKDELCESLNLDRVAVKHLLVHLSAQGMVGVDVSANRVFHRKLPFNPQLGEKSSGRIQGAQEILEAKGVELINETKDQAEYRVRGTEGYHHVHREGSHWTCTCKWYAKHQDTRGPCKHILAAMVTKVDDR